MSYRVVWRGVIPALLFLAIASSGFRAQGQDGIYADFATSMGSFTCRLDYAVAPIAVANFIGLANGEQPWVDMRTGAVKTNHYYEGLTFHRVISDFMIQGGSPNGLGTDGPGYIFTDEFDSSVRFNAFGTLAMANSGLDSNGAQYFITVTNNASWLNDKHTIFGKVVGGSNIVYAISRVATDTTDKPLTNVVVQRIQIRRVGTAAQAFDIHKQGLPTVTNPPVEIRDAETNNVALTFTKRAFTLNRVFSSTNLVDWKQELFESQIPAPQTNTSYATKDTSSKFYSVAQAQYTSIAYAPTNLYARKLALKVTTGGSGTITITFDNAGGGKVSYSGSSADVFLYSWSQSIFGGGYLWPITFTGVINPLYIGLYFNNPTSGEFRGIYLQQVKGYVAIAGTFTLTTL